VGGQSSSGPLFLMSVNQDIFDTTTSGLPSSKLIFLELHVKGGSRPLRALVDTGASSNFIRVRAVHELSLFSLVKSLDSSLLVRMANGTSITIQKQTIELTYTVNDYEGTDSFFLLDLDDRLDVILGMSWLISHQPIIDWTNQSVVSFKSFNKINFINEDYISLSNAILVSDSALLFYFLTLRNMELTQCAMALHLLPFPTVFLFVFPP